MKYLFGLLLEGYFQVVKKKSLYIIEAAKAIILNDIQIC